MDQTAGAIRPPYETFREKLQERGWSLEEFASKAMISQMDAQKLYNGDLPYNDEIVTLLLEAAFDIPMSFWSGLEKEYQKSLEQNAPVLTYEKLNTMPYQAPDHEQPESHTTSEGETPRMAKKTKQSRIAWTSEEDEILKAFVNEAKRYGDSNKSAFEKASEELKRPASACSTRFYQLLQGRVGQNRKEAPKQKASSAAPAPIQVVEIGEAPDFDALYHALDQAKEVYNQNKQLQERVTELEGIENDYKTVLRVMEAARKSVFLGKDDEDDSKYRVDRFGNVERIK